ncbi:hypothetical protein LSAT2_010387 [Lamellibrachia satsuma]|nr:hypothetical protein LSAT2_010387 [Lamellibrachia satsuma]
MRTYFLLQNTCVTEDMLIGKNQVRNPNIVEVTFINDGRQEHPPGSSNTSGSRSPMISRNKVQPMGRNSLPGSPHVSPMGYRDNVIPTANSSPAGRKAKGANR